MIEFFRESLHVLLLLAGGCIAAWASAHALLNKRDPRSAAAWVAMIVFFPFFGAFLYALLGVNRIRMRARRLHDLPRDFDTSEPLSGASVPGDGFLDPAFLNLARLGQAVSQQAIVRNSHIEPLENGDRAYPAMIAAIQAARSSVWLASYIFEVKGAGAAFVDALVAARDRGVEVRILVDGIGDLYAWPRASASLSKRGLAVARFLPPGPRPPAFSINLRNHRKLLLVDGAVGFTGGMNIRSRHLKGQRLQPDVADIHFMLRGEVVAQLAQVFKRDWHFTTGESLELSPVEPIDGNSACRVIMDGPSEDLDKLIWMLVGAIALARENICIMTPYFAPPRELIMAIQTAALRGVKVRILLPAHNNFSFMTWAAVHAIGPLLRTGAEVAFVEGPFVHSKVFIVDAYYAQIGSSNLDHRSLRLNFELAVEVYDPEFASLLQDYFERMAKRAMPMNFRQWRARSLPRRLRDGAFWLLSPYI